MNERFRILLLTIGIGMAPLYLLPVPMHGQENEMQRAHDAGYQNGVTDARRNRPMNPNTGDWHGDRLTAYQRAYEEGYQSVAGSNNGARYYNDPESQRAFQTGYNNGMRAAQENRPMNL